MLPDLKFSLRTLLNLIPQIYVEKIAADLSNENVPYDGYFTAGRGAFGSTWP